MAIFTSILVITALELGPKVLDKYVDKSRAYALLSVSMMAVWGLYFYASIDLSPSHSLAAAFSNFLPQAKSVKSLEAIMALTWLWHRQRHPQQKLFNTLLATYALLTLVLVGFHDQDKLVYLNNALSHALAPLHIISAMAAKVLVIGLLLSAIAGDSPDEIKKKRNLISLAISLQAMTLLSGMYWALWAQRWGALWQWDAIETQSLTLYLALLIMHRKVLNPPSASVYLWLALCLQLVIIYFGVGKSRHAFAASRDAMLLGAYFFLTLPFLTMLLRKHRFSPMTKQSHHPGMPILVSLSFFVALGLSVLIWLGFGFAPWLLFGTFTVIMVTIDLNFTSRRPWLRRLISVAGILVLGVTCAYVAVPEQSSGWLRSAGDARSSITTDGHFHALSVIQAEPLPVYGMSIEWRGQMIHFPLPYARAEDGVIYPRPQNLSLISAHGLERLMITDYKANEGLWVFRSSHNLQVLWGLALALWLVFRHRAYWPKRDRRWRKKRPTLPMPEAQS